MQIEEEILGYKFTEDADSLVAKLKDDVVQKRDPYSNFKQKCVSNSGINNENEQECFPDTLLKTVQSIALKEGYLTNEINTKKISTVGGNYLGVLYEADIKGTTIDGYKETNIFIKQIIPGDQMKILSVEEAYKKESFMYTEMGKVYEELQETANVPSELRFKIVESYEANSEAIYLRNLAKEGFKTCHRMDVIPLKFAELSIQQLAKFHGLSYIVQKQKPEYFEKRLQTMKPHFICNEQWEMFTKNMLEMTCKELRESSKKKVEGCSESILKKYSKYMEDNSVIGCCICHSDYRPNNILFKEMNGEIIEVIPVDYQLLSYGCPLNDFMYFIFCGTDQEFRRNHLEHLKNLYFDTLATFLTYFDLAVESFYPRQEFEKQYRERLDFGLIVALYLLPFCFVADTDVPNLGKDELSTLNFHLDSKFEERVQGVIDDFIDWGYL